MRMIDAYLMEFDREAATTRKVLERVPGDRLDFRPHPKSYSLGQLANHVATLPSWIGSTLLSDGFDLAGGHGQQAPDSTAEMMKSFEAACGTAKTAMAQLDDEKAMGSWVLSHAGKEIMSFPRIGLVRTILLNHWYHHRGQLTVYLRLLDIPLPSVYGPSADDNPFLAG